MQNVRELTVLRPDALAVDDVVAGFSLRHGGVSPRPFDTLNLGLSTGDDAANVHENRRLLFDQEGLTSEGLAIAGQVHGKEVLTVDTPGLYPGFDGLVTKTAGVVLCITSADCAVVLLADVRAGVVGACHSGWRGTVERVASHTVAAMVRMGAQTRRIRAYISPCICTDHFEVGPEVAVRFDEVHVVRRPDWPRPHVDLKAAVAAQLVDSGVDSDFIETSSRCTFAETHDFYSYRAENGATGRMMGFISLA